MKTTHKDIDIKLLEELTKNSLSFVEVTRKLNFDPGNKYANKRIERLIKKHNINVDHFPLVKRFNESKTHYEKEFLTKITKESYTYKEILEKIGLMPVESNYKTLKKYLKKFEIDDAHIIKYNPNKNLYSKENLLKVVKLSNCVADVLRNLGIITGGGNFRTIKKYIDLYNIDISHFNGETIKLEKLKLLNEKTKTPLCEILVTGSTFNRTHLKERLYSEGLKERKCELCGQDEYWNGKKMSLILDHINGVGNDNRIENLRIVCPNCNATLETHCGKNNSKRSKKLKENGFSVFDDINFTQVLTKERIEVCKKRRKVERPPYNILIEEIKNSNYCAVGRKYGVSDTTIRKWVKIYEKHGEF